MQNKIEELNKQLQQAIAENEGLKSLNDFNIQKVETLQTENEELKKQYDKYSQCLDEIEKIVKLEDCLNCPSLEFCSFSEKICNDFKIETISEIIKQAKEGEGGIDAYRTDTN